MNHYSITSYTCEEVLDIGKDVAFTYNGKARQGKVIQEPRESKTGSIFCRVECIGEEFPKTFTVDKMDFQLC